MKQMEANRPVKKFRVGAISAAVWENEVVFDGRPQKLLKASVERRYKDRDGAWKSSAQFGRNEIPLAIWVLLQAFDAIAQKEEEARESAVTEERVR